MSDREEQHPDEQHLAAFDAGDLTAAGWDEVAAHVSNCAMCCDRLDRIPPDALTMQVRTAERQPHATLDGELGGADAATPSVSDTDAAPNALPLPPELVAHPRYRVLGLLGAGGMGEVFRAEHRLMERVVALKVMHQTLLNRPAAVAQFREEVKAATRLCHPNIVAAYDAEQAGDVHFLVMEFVAGTSLDRVVAQRGPLPVAEACDYIRQVADGLQHAAERGIVHRDIKPHNLMLTPGGVVKILDFGLARLACREAEPRSSVGTPGHNPRRVTVTGTPDYMAPEQVTAPHEADARADIYSLGRTFQYLLAGRVVPVTAAGSDTVPAAVKRIIDRMVAADPADRYTSAGDVSRQLAALDRVGAAAHWRRRPALLTLAALIAVAAVGAAIWLTGAWYRSEADAAANDSPAAVAKPTPDPEPAPTEPAPTGTPVAETTAPRRAVADQVTEWLRENCKQGPDHAMVGQLSARVAGALESGRCFELSMGRALVKSGQPTLLTTWSGEFFVLGYTPAQAAAMDLSAQKVEFRDTGARQSPIRATPLLELADPRIDTAQELDPAQPITGEITYRRLETEEGDFALRLRCSPGKNSTTRYFRLKGGLPAKEGTIRFQYGPLESAGTPYGGPIPVFFDVIVFTEPNRTDRVIVVSRPIAMLVTVARR
jgi:hypothetical protein